MDAREIASALAPTATVKELSSRQNRAFRLLEEHGASSVVKVYATTARERRERHAIEALAGIEGVPTILERGATDGTPWIRFADGGTWSLATLPRNLEVVKRAGRALKALHSANAAITNLDSGIDAQYVATHLISTLDRLERFRRRLGISAELLASAKIASSQPPAGDPAPAHTRPVPENFLVSDKGAVTLIDWEWATLAPPEWDLSMATWRFSKQLGPESAEALLEGYGATFPAVRLKPWITYHTATMMLDAAESREGRLGDLSYLVDDLAASVR